MGFRGFLCSRKVMLGRWTEAAIVKLRRAAHNIDMRLSRPIEWIEMFHETGGEPEIEMGIGLNAGQVVVGNIGSEARAKYGIVGSEVNLTQPIQGVAKGVEVVISKGYSQEPLPIKRSFDVQLKGFHHPVNLYVIDSSQDLSLGK
jgi:class 3 adenylate cyclase